MDEHSAHRTLVKSPPELWAEVSDTEALAKHLGEFGAVRITQLEPETTVAWEGDRVRGTVRLEPSGWGTRVTLTAQVPEPPPPEQPKPTPLRPVPDPDPDPDDDEDPEPRPLVAEAPVAPEGGLLARWWRRWTAGASPRSAPPAPPATTAPAVAPERAPDALRAAPDPIAVPIPATEPAELASEPPPGADEEASDDANATAILTRVLDDLGAAHHRPFSRA